MNISQILTKLKSLVYSKSEADTLLSSKASSSHKHTKSEITDFPTIPSKTSQLTNDSGFLTAHQSLSDYSTKANTVKSLSISGKTITVTPGSGNAYTLTTQDTTYTLPTASSTLGGVKTTSTVSNSSGYTACPIISGVPYYKDTNTTYSLSSLGIGNVKNYDQSKAIKSISRSGTTFTYTCLDGTTGTFTQQDNNTTYSFSDKNVTLAWGTKSTIATVGGTDIHVTMPANPNTNTWTAMVGATSSANGSVGYVNAVPPKDGYNTKYLRADGTWQVPPDHTYTVNNATLTIQKNGSNVATFTANASSNATANITVPTKVSQLTNDSGFITSSGSCNYANSAGSASSATTADVVSTSVADGSSKDLVYATMAGSDAFRIRCGGGDDAGYVEIATSDNGNEPIYVRQYNLDGGNGGDFTTIVRTLTLLDGSGNTQFPGTVTAPTFSGNLNGNCSGTAGGVAWGNVSGRPTAVSKFTNDAGFITSAVKESSYGGDENYCLLYGNLLIQFGTCVFTTGSGSITFRKAFSSAPIIIVNYGDDAGFSSPCCLDEAYTTYFTVKQAIASSAWRVNWIAIGRA